MKCWVSHILLLCWVSCHQKVKFKFAHHSFGAMTLSITTFSITTILSTTKNKKHTQDNNIQCLCQDLLCWLSFMLTVTIKSIMLSVIMLNVVIMNVVAPLFSQGTPTQTMIVSSSQILLWIPSLGTGAEDNRQCVLG
jgi:hypothetical protein